MGIVLNDAPETRLTWWRSFLILAEALFVMALLFGLFALGALLAG